MTEELSDGTWYREEDGSVYEYGALGWGLIDEDMSGPMDPSLRVNVVNKNVFDDEDKKAGMSHGVTGLGSLTPPHKNVYRR